MSIKQNNFDRLGNANDRIIEEISKNCSPLGKSEKNRIFSMIEKEYNKRVDSDTEFTPAYEVKGVERYMRPKWYKPVCTAAISLVVIGGIAGSVALTRNLRNKQPDTTTSDIPNNVSADTIINKSYDNLIFSDDFIVDFPEIECFETFQMVQKPALSGQEYYDRFHTEIEQFFPGIYSDEEIDQLASVVMKDSNGNTINGPLVDYKEKIISGEYPAPFALLTCNDFCIQMFSNGSTQTVTGNAARSIDKNNSYKNSVGMYCAADDNRAIKKLHIPTNGSIPDEEYDLLSGKVKLSDAISYTENFLNNEFDIGIANPELVADVTDAWIVDMGNGVFGYHFFLTSTYNGVRIETMPMRKASSASVSSNGADKHPLKSYSNFPGYAFTIEEGKLDSVQIYGFIKAYDIVNAEKHDEMLSLEQATDILSNEVTGGSGLQINRAEFVYATYSKDNEDDTSNLSVDAVWKYVASNQNDGKGYVFLVNAVTGEFDYYVY